MRQYKQLFTKQFRKDVRRLQKSRFDLARLQHIVGLLASDQVLPDNCRDHPLHGQLKGSRECHIGPDWLLRYSKDDGLLILLLISTGTHRHVLGIE